MIETQGRLLPVEIKASNQARIGDASNLRLFRAEYGEQARSGLLLHTGDHLGWLTSDVLAVPWWMVV